MVPRRHASSMRIAYIVLAHKLPEQLIRLVHRLDGQHALFLIHIDRRVPRGAFAGAVRELRRNPRVRFLKRHRCDRSGFGTVAAVLEGMRELEEERLPFDHAIRLSGQDYPIKSNEEIVEFLKRNRERSFMQAFPLARADLIDWPEAVWYEWTLRYRRWHSRPLGRHIVLPFAREVPGGFEPFGGEACWCLTRECVSYVNEFIRRERHFVRFFRHVDKPDEMFFQTILINSPRENRIVRDDVHYTDWTRGRSHPEILTSMDFDRLRRADDLFARKFDSGIDSKILDLIDTRLVRY
jgi:hypothetical protein